MSPLPIFLFLADCDVDRMVENRTIILFQEIDVQEVKEINQRKSGMKAPERHGIKRWLLPSPAL